MKRFHFIVPLYPAWLVMIVSALVPLFAGCDRAKPQAAAAHSGEAPAAATNRVDINAAVRQNLGITFAKVESRAVARTLRLPGRFELLPTSRREYREIAAGIVELLVSQYQIVEAGTPLYRIDSPTWRELQRDLAEADNAVRQAQAEADSIAPLLEAHERHHTELQKSVDLWTARVNTLDQLRAGGGVRGEDLALAKASQATANSALAETYEKEAELEVRKVRSVASLATAQARMTILINAASSMTRLSPAELRAPSESDGTIARWQTLNTIEVRAIAAGVVDVIHVTSGGLVDEHAAILETVQPELVRFRAMAMQSDLPRLAAGLRASIVPAAINADAGTKMIPGTITLAPTADPERRTLDLIHNPDAGSAQPWARAGVSAFLEVAIAGGGSDELAIPLRCVARDGTQAIIFRRDPGDPDKAIRMEADLGIDDGRWVVIKSGVAEGNEIVLDGVYQLMVATSGSITKGGHFHPDGTFHEGKD